MKSGSSKEHRGSMLLNEEENEQVFQLIGNRCQCLAAGIAQLYLTEGPLHKEWLKKDTGVITLIKDNPKHSYFFRLYCLQKNAMLWEHEVYNAMDYKAPMSYFHTFEGEDSMIAFNFANETDAQMLRSIILQKLNAKRQRRQERKSKIAYEPHHLLMLPKTTYGNAAMSFNSDSVTNVSSGSPSFTTVNRSISSSSMYKTKKIIQDKDSKRKFTKADIGSPSDFRHLESMDPKFKKFFDKVGVSNAQLQDRDTRTFIYDFITTHGGINAIKEDIVSTASIQSNLPPSPLPGLRPLPPVPVRTVPVSPAPLTSSHQLRNAPPVPPPPTAVPPPLPIAPPVYKHLPTPPVLPFVVSPPIPPPPLPPPALQHSSSALARPPLAIPTLTYMDNDATNSNATNNANLPDPTSTLLESIRGGTTLNKVDRHELSPDSEEDTKDSLLHQIRQGIELKSVANQPKSAPSPTENDNLAGALIRALSERSRAIRSDSEDSSSNTSEDEWDE